MNTIDRYAKIREALEMEVPAMRELPRDLVTILRTEASNQRTPPIDYVIAEDGGRMVHTPEPDIAMAELLEEAAAALASERAALAEARKALGMMLKEHDILSGNFGDVMDPKHKRPDRWPTAAEAARRALKSEAASRDE